MRNYLIRSVAYLLKMVVLLAAIFVVMVLTKTSEGNGGDLFAAVFLSQKGLLLLATLLVLAAVNPIYGYVSRSVRGSIDEHKEQVINTLASCGYTLTEERDGVLTFRAVSTVKRLINFNQEEIRVWQDGREIVVNGIRSEVVKASYRLSTTILS